MVPNVIRFEVQGFLSVSNFYLVAFSRGVKVMKLEIDIRDSPMVPLTLLTKHYSFDMFNRFCGIY